MQVRCRPPIGNLQWQAKGSAVFLNFNGDNPDVRVLCDRIDHDFEMFLIYIPLQTFGHRPPIFEVYVGCSVRYLRPREPLVAGFQLELGVGILEFHKWHVCNTLQKGGIGNIIAGVHPFG